MKRFFLFFVLSLFASSPAFATDAFHKGDMFGESSWVGCARPRVASDERRGEQMIRAVPLLFHPNADMFHSLSKAPLSDREDMLSTRLPASFPTGRLFGDWKDR